MSASAFRRWAFSTALDDTGRKTWLWYLADRLAQAQGWPICTCPSRIGPARRPGPTPSATPCARYPGKIIAAGGLHHRKAETLLKAKLIDAVVFGRPFISNRAGQPPAREGSTRWWSSTRPRCMPHGAEGIPIIRCIRWPERARLDQGAASFWFLLHGPSAEPETRYGVNGKKKHPLRPVALSLPQGVLICLPVTAGSAPLSRCHPLRPCRYNQSPPGLPATNFFTSALPLTSLGGLPLPVNNSGPVALICAALRPVALV